MKKFIQKFLKILSTIVFWILIVIIIVLVGYISVIKVLEKQGKIAEVPINFYTILSQSMYPTIKAGDIIITYQNDNYEYQVGDVITFVSTSGPTNGVTITHKIVSIDVIKGERFYTTKGDNNSTKDSNPVSENNVIGKYIFKIPKAGFVQQFLISKTGWIVAIVIPSLGIIIYDVIKIVKKIPSKSKEKKNKKNIKIDEDAKSDLIEVIENKPVPVEVKKQVDEAYNDMGIPIQEEIENLFDEPEKQEGNDETEIL